MIGDGIVKEEYWGSQEKRILRIFQRKGHLFLTHIPDRLDIFQWLALMQHYGAPTRLLDFTNPNRTYSLQYHRQS